MSITKFAVAIAIVGAIWGKHAQAQSGYPQSLSSRSYSTYYSQDEAASPSDAPLPPAVNGEHLHGINGCDPCATVCGPLGLDCPEYEPWRLFGCNEWLECRGIQVYGWLNFGATANGRATPSRFNGPVGFNDRREFQMNQLYTVIEREADNHGCGFAWGGRADLMYGTDFIFVQSRGLETTQDGDPRWNSGRHYGLAMPQLYLDLAYNDWLFRMGHFYTIIGYEGVMAPDQFFYSHPYAHMYGEPFTHTGMLATRSIGDQWEISAGFHRGWDNWENIPGNDVLSFLGGVSWTSADENTELAFALTTGQEEAAQEGDFANRSMYSIVLSRQLTDRFSYVLQHDYGFQHRGANEGTQNAEWYGINQYFFYQINCCWTAGMRVEWFRDHRGTQVAGVRPGNPSEDGGFNGNFWAFTWGLNWKPNPNVIIRPELRYDTFHGSAGANQPFNDGNSNDQFTAAVDVILLW